MDDATYKKLKEELQEIYKNSRNLAEAAKITMGNNIDTAVNNLIKVCQQLEELLKPVEPQSAKKVEKVEKVETKQETVETSTSSPKTE
jgi:ABC-type transporter Mla subunit MlaD